jgi:carbonic anhydrase
MTLSEFAAGNEIFQRAYFKKHEQELLDLVTKGQQPKALFIGCSDSRVIPDLIIQSNPGDLFVLRNVGNFVPPFKPDEDYHATASGIEYAINVLNVSEVIICGHSHCGACKSLFQPIDDPNLVHIRKWLDLGEKAKTMALLSLGPDAGEEELLRLTERLSIITQIDNLMSYPFVKERLEKDQLFIHGWYYDIATGNIEYYDPDQYRFLPLSDLPKRAASAPGD